MSRSKTTRSSAARERVRSANGEDGFTVVEVLVAISVFTVLAIAATIALITTVKLTTYTQDRVAATNIARQQIAKIRQINNTGVGTYSEGAQTPVILKLKTYNVDLETTPDITTTCTSAGVTSRRVTVSVTWNSSPQRSIRLDTTIAC